MPFLDSGEPAGWRSRVGGLGPAARGRMDSWALLEALALYAARASPVV
jgi:hypothetical protein